MADLKNDSSSRHDDLESIVSINRFESGGRLAGGFIHDLNNTLGVLFGYLEMALEECDPDSPVHRQLLCVEKSADKARETVSRYHQLCRRVSDYEQSIDLVRESRELVNTLEVLFPSAIFIVVEWPERPLFVRGKASLWCQALLNVLLRARDSMPDGGTIKMGLDLRDGYACVEVLDQGEGMNRGQILSDCEPFSGVDGSASLGLAASSFITRQMGGELTIHSSPESGTGTRIVFHIPLDPNGPAQ